VLEYTEDRGIALQGGFGLLIKPKTLSEQRPGIEGGPEAPENVVASRHHKPATIKGASGKPGRWFGPCGLRPRDAHERGAPGDVRDAGNLTLTVSPELARYQRACSASRS
jgi:hypothetical protein